jgi:hypothetical protein
VREKVRSKRASFACLGWLLVGFRALSVLHVVDNTFRCAFTVSLLLFLSVLEQAAPFETSIETAREMLVVHSRITERHRDIPVNFFKKITQLLVLEVRVCICHTIAEKLEHLFVKRLGIEKEFVEGSVK